MIKCLFSALLLLSCLSRLEAENCPDCPVNDEGNQHRKLIQASDFHCDQIRQLRIEIEKIKKLEEIIKAQEEKIERLEVTIEHIYFQLGESAH